MKGAGAVQRGLLLPVSAVLAAVVLAVLAAKTMRRQVAARAAVARELEESREREEALIRTVDQLSDANPQRHGLRAVR